MIVWLSNLLAGWPEVALSGILIGIGAFLMLAGLFANRVVKLPLALWAIL